MSYDAVVIGGGPGGSATATYLAAGGLRVALFEREEFPRFHIGESLLPASMLLLEELGVREEVDARFQVKRGAMISDVASGLGHTFYFLRGQPWPDYTYQVLRSEFDALLLANARKRGVDVHQPATVEHAEFDGDGVTVTVSSEGGRRPVRARMLVDASGRDGFLASRIGQRRRMPNLGKVAVYSHFRGAERLAGADEGNLRAFVFDGGWFWWIPLRGDVTSVGAVLHARTVREWGGDTEGLYAAMLGRCAPVAAGLAGAERILPVITSANFSYVNTPVVGDRFLAVGDAVTFIDPIFSAGVHIAMASGRLAARAIIEACADGRFAAARFAAYERAVWQGIRPLFRLIHGYYEPPFLEVLLRPRPWLGVYAAVLHVLSGGSFFGMGWRTRAGLATLNVLARLNTWVRRRAGQPVESRLEW